jgi:putative DNA primase/helicase
VFGNAKPTIANPDDGGMRRRLRLVPFEVSFADAPDKKLDVTLRKEATGILADLVRACLAWQKDGLTEPTVIADATAEYFAEQDTIGRFVAERCDLNPLAKMSRKDLRLALDAWADEVGEEKVNPKDIAKWLAQHNVTGTSVRDAGNRPVDGWAGIRLKLVAASNVDTRIGERDAS